MQGGSADATASALTARRLRWLITTSAVVMSAVLALSVWRSWMTTRAATETLARGQAQVFRQAVRSALDGAAEDVPQRLRAVLAEHAQEGLRCVAVFGPDESLRAQAGCEAEPGVLRAALRGLGADGMARVGERVRVAYVPPAPHDRIVGPPGVQLPPGAEPPGPPGTVPGRRLQARPLALLVEFRPLEAEALRQDANLSFGIGVGGALALLAAALFVGRLLRRAERARAQEARQRRLAALGEMSAVLAHEIRNPLTSLKGNAQLLAELLDPGGRPHRKAVRVVHEATRLEKLTTDLMDFVRTEALRRGAAAPVELLRAAVRASDAGAVEIQVAEDVPARWDLDARLVTQTLANLLRNACQASPPGAAVEAWVGVRGGELVFTVRDHGAGVPPGECERIFEPFHTNRVRGTGLGLAIARRVARLHGGDVRAGNHAEGGAVFTVTLPPGRGEEEG